MRYVPSQILSGAMTQNLTSSVMDLQQAVNVGLCILAAAGATGSITIEVSNDPVQRPQDIVNWSQYQAPTALSGAASNTSVSLQNVCFKWLRVRYAFTSGSGQLVVNSMIHGV